MNRDLLGISAVVVAPRFFGVSRDRWMVGHDGMAQFRLVGHWAKSYEFQPVLSAGCSGSFPVET